VEAGDFSTRGWDDLPRAPDFCFRGVFLPRDSLPDFFNCPWFQSPSSAFIRGFKARSLAQGKNRGAHISVFSAQSLICHELNEWLSSLRLPCESPTLNYITISVLAGSFTLVSRRNPCRLKSAKAPPDIFELDFTFGQINYSSLPFFNRGNNAIRSSIFWRYMLWHAVDVGSIYFSAGWPQSWRTLPASNCAPRKRDINVRRSGLDSPQECVAVCDTKRHSRQPGCFSTVTYLARLGPCRYSSPKSRHQMYGPVHNLRKTWRRRAASDMMGSQKQRSTGLAESCHPWINPRNVSWRHGVPLNR